MNNIKRHRGRRYFYLRGDAGSDGRDGGEGRGRVGDGGVDGGLFAICMQIQPGNKTSVTKKTEVGGGRGSEKSRQHFACCASDRHQGAVVGA